MNNKLWNPILVKQKTILGSQTVRVVDIGVNLSFEKSSKKPFQRTDIMRKPKLMLPFALLSEIGTVL